MNTEDRSSTHDRNHETLSRFAFVYTVDAFGGGVPHRVGRYDAERGKLELEDTDNPCSDSWRYDGTQWVCENLTEEDGTPITETEFTGGDRCLHCGSVYETDQPEERYCGC
jgi:hypothetical protein